MFCAVAIDDVEVLEKISAECNHKFDRSCTMNLLFILGDRPSGVGCARYLSSDTIRIEFVGLIEGARGKGFGDFLTRSMINKVMDLCKVVEVNSKSEYFLKFGFELVGDVMRAKSEKIVFPSKCKH
ncbi:MAG: hypothetical protein IJF76_05765 [Clostridia bacterium]|nr:hypothetical protein [Clostridia bacterium]